MKWLCLLLPLFLTGCFKSEAEKKHITGLEWTTFCESRGGKSVSNWQKYGSSYYCVNGEHTHFDD